MQCQYRSYVELLCFLQKQEKLFTRVNCVNVPHSKPLCSQYAAHFMKRAILPKCRVHFNQKKKKVKYTGGLSCWFVE